MSRSLPDNNHVGRLCGDRGISGEKVKPAAFVLRPQDEGHLSVNWVECPHASEPERNVEGCKTRLAKLTNYSQYIAILNAGEIRKIIYKDRALDVIETGWRSNPCHCSIIGMDREHECFLVRKELADLANKNSIHWLKIEG
jgi:hypothetical protein